jgi:hypothetical protein
MVRRRQPRVQEYAARLMELLHIRDKVEAEAI